MISNKTTSTSENKCCKKYFWCLNTVRSAPLRAVSIGTFFRMIVGVFAINMRISLNLTLLLTEILRFCPSNWQTLTKQRSYGKHIPSNTFSTFQFFSLQPFPLIRLMVVPVPPRWVTYMLPLWLPKVKISLICMQSRIHEAPVSSVSFSSNQHLLWRQQ